MLLRGTSRSWWKPYEAQQKQMQNPGQTDPTHQDRLVEAGKERTWRFSKTSSCTWTSSVPTWQRSVVNWAVLAKAQTANQEKGIFPSIQQLWDEHCFQLGLPQYKEVTDELEWIQQHTTRVSRGWSITHRDRLRELSLPSMRKIRLDRSYCCLQIHNGYL